MPGTERISEKFGRIFCDLDELKQRVAKIEARDELEREQLASISEKVDRIAASLHEILGKEAVRSSVYGVIGKPRPDGTRLEKSSVSKRLSDIRAICGTGLRDWFEDEGFSRPVFDIPVYRVVKHKVKVMTQEQDCKVENWMRRLSCSADPIEQRMFVALWFERLFGMRPGDINRLTWDCIHIDGPIVRLVYKPNKTKKCPGRDDPIIVPMKIWSYVAPFYVSGGLLLPRLRKARSADSRNRAIWSRINRQYREWGICDDVAHGKASYINRRQRITEAFEKDGIRGASAIGKNTPKVQMEHYVAVGEYVA